jgi:hypothetical protein
MPYRENLDSDWACLAFLAYPHVHTRKEHEGLLLLLLLLLLPRRRIGVRVRRSCGIRTGGCGRFRVLVLYIGFAATRTITWLLSWLLSSPDAGADLAVSALGVVCCCCCCCCCCKSCYFLASVLALVFNTIKRLIRCTLRRKQLNYCKKYSKLF